jgi:DNA-binding NarL/FixJ family response regulator
MIHGEIPQKMCVLHKCDNRKCTNPDHLYLGTYIENDRDRVERNRQAKGSKNGSAKLNEQQVKEIKIMLKNGFTQKEIAIKFNMSQATIGFIASGRLWKHVIID